MRFLFQAAVFLFLIGPGAGTFVFSTPAENPADFLPTQWTIENGLPQNTVHALCRSVDGYLWLGTRSGVVRFDGMRFHVFNRWNSPLLPGEEVLALFPDPGGGLWVGTSAGLAFLGKTGWETVSLSGGAAFSLPVTALAGDPDGNLWVGSSSGLFRMETGSRELRPAEGRDNSRPVAALAPAPRGGVYLGTGDGELVYLTAGPPVQRESLSRVPGTLHSLALDAKGSIWLAASSGLYHLDGSGKVPRRRALADDAVPMAVLPLADARVWVGTRQHGLMLLSGEAEKECNGHESFTGRSVLSLMRDQEGNLWAGTDLSGLFRLRKRAIRPLGADVGPVAAVIEKDPGEIWIARRRGGIVRFRDGERVAAANRTGIFKDQFPAISFWRQPSGSLWIGTAGRGLYLFPTGNRRERSFLKDLAVSIHGVMEDGRGGLWVATDRGLYQGVSDTFQPVAISAEGMQERIAAFSAGEGNDFWAGGNRGVWRYREGNWSRLPFMEKGDGPRQVTALFVDNNGVLWAGTAGWGLFGHRDGRWIQLDESTGLPDNYILGVLQDDAGYLWCGCHRGVFRIQEPDTRKLLAENVRPVDCLVWNESEGMASSECVADAQPSAWKTSDGHLLFATVRGVADVDPRGVSRKSPHIPVLVEAVLADSRPLGLNTSPRLTGKVEMLEIYYTCPSLAAPEKVIFRYRLRGFDDRWTVSSPRQERTALYLNLGPGEYGFEISARSNAGEWTPPGRVYSFQIGGGGGMYVLLTLLLLAAGMGFLLSRRRSATPVPEKYRTSGLTADVAKNKLDDLLRLMEQEKPYLDANLSLSRLAKSLGIHTNYLSRIINEHRNQSFNDFINQYRIREARARLEDPASAELTILQIAYETGFYSKSVFNTAFKKFTGMTPSECRRTARSG